MLHLPLNVHMARHGSVSCCVRVPFFVLCNFGIPVWFDMLKIRHVFRPLCENYVIKWTRQGMAKDLDQLNNFKVSIQYVTE
jgi:hypothetical protein